MNKGRCYNFSAGPAMLPIEVMQQAQAEFLNWHDSGMSVMEISHRGDEFKVLAEQSEQDLRDLLDIPNNYKVLFLHGGSRSQFAMVPMNIAKDYPYTAYLRTGIWSEISAKEAELYNTVKLVADTQAQNYTCLPSSVEPSSFSQAAYLYYVDNETVNGVEFNDVPNSGEVPLVSDMSSNLLTRKFDVSQFGIIFACAQKNLGPAGVTVVIIRDDLLERTPIATTPSMFNYKLHVETNSMQNTSPTYPWYMLSLVLQWMKQKGGIEAFEKLNFQKSAKLYDFIDASDFYSNAVETSARSRMNVIFQLPTTELEQKFAIEAEAAGLKNLKGHRFVGGCRASIYNAMPMAGIDKLLEFMQTFRKKH